MGISIRRFGGLGCPVGRSAAPTGRRRDGESPVVNGPLEWTLVVNWLAPAPLRPAAASGLVLLDTHVVSSCQGYGAAERAGAPRWGYECDLFLSVTQLKNVNAAEAYPLALFPKA
jgi:hypothetical protein